jgi:hypothetical protein
VDIADVHAALVPEIHERMWIVREKLPMAEVSRTFEELSVLFEGLGLCHLLESVDLAELAENLCRSGHARRYFLRRSQQEGNLRDRRLALSRTPAFFDAIVAGDVPLARDVASLSITTWEPAWEYEDDFCFFFYLHRVALGFPPGGPDQIAILDRFERALEGASSARLDACRAIAARDAPALAKALSERLDEIAGELDEERESSAVQEEADVAFWPRSFVSIEGLALLQMATVLGLPVPGDLPLCPRVARLPVRAAAYPDFFAEIELMP